MAARVACLSSLLGTDEATVRLLPRAVAALGEQDCALVHMRRLVEWGDGALPPAPRGVVPVTSTAPGLESMPASLNALWAALPAGVEYAAVYNADDHWLPRGLDALVALLDEDPGAALAYGDFEMVMEGGQSMGTGMVLPPGASVARSPVPGPFALFRVSAARQAQAPDGQLFDESYPRCFDWHLWVRLSKIGRFLVCRQPVGVFLHRPSSLSHADPAAFRAEQARLRAWAPGYLAGGRAA